MAKCLACGGKGWLHAVVSETDELEIQRCDDCLVFALDDVAEREHENTCRERGYKWKRDARMRKHIREAIQSIIDRDGQEATADQMARAVVVSLKKVSI